jgi:tetratricopeptide (TPR) repeat protein
VAQRWRSENLDLELETQRLILLLRETERSLLAFALYRTVAEREAVARELRERLPLPVEEFTLTTARRNPFDLIEGVKADGRVACFVYDVEDAFPEALGYLNLQRERLAELPHAVVFWVREHGLRQIGVQAPDFWAWRSGVFDFRALEERPPLAAVELAVAEPFTYLDRGDLERRLSLYQGLLEDYSQEERPDEAFLAELEHKIGLACYYLGEWAEARVHWQRALEISEGAGDEEGRAVALHSLGILAQDQGDYAAARHFYRESLDIKQALGDQAGMASTLHNLGTLAQEQGDYTAARRFYQQGIEIDQILENRIGVASTTYELGTLAQEQGDYDAARRVYRQSLETFQALGDRAAMASVISQLGISAKLQGNYAEAIEMHQKSLEVRRDLGDKKGMAIDLHQLGMLAQDQGDYAAARHFYRESLDIEQALGDQAGVAFSCAQLALLEEAVGDLDSACQLTAKAAEIFEEIQAPHHHQRALEQLRQLEEKRQNKP